MTDLNKLVLASANPGKIKELQEWLDKLGITIVPQGDLGIPDIEETGLSFVENAILKARNASALSNLPAIADDSGIEVDYLKGAPGIYSARFSGEHATDATNRTKLLKALEGVHQDKRTARYQAVIVYLRHAQDPTPIICQGFWEGEITLQRDGDNGFGYDPVFYVPEKDCTSAQLAPNEKHQLSHRGKALKQLIEQIKDLDLA